MMKKFLKGNDKEDECRTSRMEACVDTEDWNNLYQIIHMKLASIASSRPIVLFARLKSLTSALSVIDDKTFERKGFLLGGDTNLGGWSRVAKLH
jgi:hypothetical protein